MALIIPNNFDSFTRANDCKDQSLDLTSDVNQATELLAEEIIDAGNTFQSLMVSGKKLLINVSSSI